MKKLCIFMCFALMLGLFSACKAPAKEELLPSVENTPEVSENPSPQVSEEPEVTPEPEETPLPEPDILDNKEPIDRKGVLSRVPNELVSSGTGQKILPFGEDILVWGPVSGSDGGPAVRLFVLGSSGSTLAEKVFDGMDLANVQVCSDKIALADFSDGEFLLLDSELEILSSVNTETEYCGIYSDPQAENIYVFTKEDGIRVIPLGDGEEYRLLENVSGLYASKENSHGVGFTCTDLDTQLAMSGILSFEKKQVQMVPFEGTFSSPEMVDDIWLAQVFGGSSEYCIGRAERPSRLYLERGSTATLLNENARIWVNTYTPDGFVISLYETDGRFISRCTLGKDAAGVYTSPVWSEKHGGYFFTVINSEGRDELLFWNISVNVVGKMLEMEPFEREQLTGSAVDRSLYERAHTIGESFGVDIRIADTCDTELTEYEMAQECSPEIITGALDAVESALSAYPEGFIDQLKFDVARHIELQLCGAISKKELPENISGFASFSGFMTRLDSRFIIVLDITSLGSLTQLLHHELAHVVHSKLMHDARLREDAVYSEDAWQALQPEGFVYAETYDEMPMEYFTDGYEDWFIDLYSRTFAKEDIARMLEYAASGQTWAFSSSPYKLAKLEYLCRCIRDAFDDTLWPEENLYEQTLTKAGN